MIWDFRAGDFLTFAGVVVAVLTAYMKRDNKIDMLTQRFDYLETETDKQSEKLDKLSELLGKEALIEQRFSNFDFRLNSQDKQIQEMKHGDGIILKRP